MTDQPKCSDVVSADLFVDQIDDVLQVFIVGGSPYPGRSVGRCDYEAVFVLIVQDREIVALPVSIGTGTVKTKYTSSEVR